MAFHFKFRFFLQFYPFNLNGILPNNWQNSFLSFQVNSNYFEANQQNGSSSSSNSSLEEEQQQQQLKDEEIGQRLEKRRLHLEKMCKTRGLDGMLSPKRENNEMDMFFRYPQFGFAFCM